MSSAPDSDVVFLGICDRANFDANKGKWNILGLGHSVFSYIFPVKLTGMYFGINASENFVQQKNTFQIVNDSGENIATITVSAERIAVPTAEDKFVKRGAETVMGYGADRVTLFLPLEIRDAVIQAPGLYHLKLVREAEGKKEIGSFQFVLVDPPPLTTDRKAAIKSDPDAVKAIIVEFGCKQCPAKYHVYTSLDKIEYPPESGWEWYEDIPDQFTCECGKTVVNLQYIRRNLHALLGQKSSKNNVLDFVPLYEKSALRMIRSNFAELLDESPEEETLQLFIKENPILLHQFPAESIMSKPPIQSRYIADFAILTAQRELIFIEIEKTTTKLMKKNGHRAADLVHAFDQVRDWLQVIDEHRLAVLDDLGIERSQVSTICGVVIAGREKGYDAQKLRRLKMSSEDRISFLTFDDLLFAMDALINKFETI
jgi:hypothetical protein